MTESLENLPRSYEICLIPEPYLSPLRETSKLLKLCFSRIISRKDISGNFDIPSYIDIYIFSDLSVNFGHFPDFPTMVKVLVDWAEEKLVESVPEYVAILTTGLTDLKHKFETRSITRATSHEMLSIYADLLLNINGILHSDSRISSKLCEKSDLPIIVILARVRNFYITWKFLQNCLKEVKFLASFELLLKPNYLISSQRMKAWYRSKV